jgi:hypothetical protein
MNYPALKGEEKVSNSEIKITDTKLKTFCVLYARIQEMLNQKQANSRIKLNGRRQFLLGLKTEVSLPNLQ